jgi:hypothetical protein
MKNCYTLREESKASVEGRNEIKCEEIRQDLDKFSGFKLQNDCKKMSV